MKNKQRPMSNEELKIQQMKLTFETLLNNWREACRKVGLEVSYLGSVGVFGLEKQHGDSLTFRLGLVKELLEHQKHIQDLVNEQVVKEIGKKDFN